MDNFEKNSPEHAAKTQKFLDGMKKGSRSKQLQAARKRLRRNLQSKTPRTRDWAELENIDWDEVDYDSDKRIMPRDETARRRAIETESQAIVDGNIEETEEPIVATGSRGRVLSVIGERCKVEIDDRVIYCSIRGAITDEHTGFTNAVAAGDDVIVDEDGAGSGAIESVLPRRSVLARPDTFYGHLHQVLVANADQILIVSSWRDPVLWLELVDRYLIAAVRSNLRAVLCVTKSDLIEDEAEFQNAITPYLNLDYTVLRASSITGEGIDDVRDQLNDNITVLAGLSGTGKSSLITALQPGLDIRVGEVSEYSGEGMHTTRQSTLHPLDFGGAIVDTPGIREFGLTGLRKSDLATYFEDIDPLTPECLFANCLHVSEPDCAVLKAESSGALSPSRYHSYKTILDTLPE